MAEPGGGRGGRAVAGERLVDHQTAYVLTCTRRCTGRRRGEVAQMWFVVAAGANERCCVVERRATRSAVVAVDAVLVVCRSQLVT